MLRVAICGAGHWGTRLIESVQGRSGKLRFAAAVTRDPEALQPLGKRFGLALTTRYADALADPAIDAVALATPHSRHADEIAQAAQAGKHVFVEKPFTLTRESAERAIEACRKAGITLHVGFNRRYAPAYAEMKRRIAAGEIGALRHLEGNFSGPPGYQTEPGNWRSNQVESPGGGMTVRGCHVLDGMVHLAGLATQVFAVSERQQHDIDVDDTTSCLLRFASGATGTLVTLQAATRFYRLHAFGSKGALESRGYTELDVFDLEGHVRRLNFEAIDKERAELEAFADATAREMAATADLPVHGVCREDIEIEYPLQPFFVARLSLSDSEADRDSDSDRGGPNAGSAPALSLSDIAGGRGGGAVADMSGHLGSSIGGHRPCTRPPGQNLKRD